MSWLDCMEWLPRLALALPSEAQWEYAARAGTNTPWWTGKERESLVAKNAANLADRSAARRFAQWSAIQDWPELDDGFPYHAPVGTFAANPFGLHEIVGNVLEWCRDGYDQDFFASSPRVDPVRRWDNISNRVTRGGAYNSTSTIGRSSMRMPSPPTRRGAPVGVRPARAIEP